MIMKKGIDIDSKMICCPLILRHYNNDIYRGGPQSLESAFHEAPLKLSVVSDVQFYHVINCDELFLIFETVFLASLLIVDGDQVKEQLGAPLKQEMKRKQKQTMMTKTMSH